jgi:hypothetical protein
VLGPVRARGHADHQQRGPPFRDQSLDRGKARAVVRSRQCGEGMGEAGLEITDRDADAPGAEVECQDGARPGVRREG